MPTIFRREGFRFYFFSNEGTEPRHVHVDRAGATAKLWLRPVVVARAVGFNGAELRALVALVDERQAEFERAWDEHFGSFD